MQAKRLFSSSLGKAMCGQRLLSHWKVPLSKMEAHSKSVRVDSVRKPRLMQVNQKGLPILYDDVARGGADD